ncbi:hypothetical protein [Mycetocola saprophilus]|uniref:hypothetical protein n=1 Tax=Mycetocola saprophilus TaxID=76636 RepID=UPI003BEFE572
MADAPIAPLGFGALKEVIVVLDGTDYGAHTSSVDATPASTTTTWRGGKSGAIRTDRSPSEWVVNLNVAQDFATPGSLANILLENDGKKAQFAFQPFPDSPFMLEVEVTLVAPKVGGAVNAFNESTVALPANGAPKVTYPTPPAPKS